MENKSILTKALALLGFALVAINGVFAFGNMQSTGFVQIYFVVALVVMVVTAIMVAKDKDAYPVIGSAILYFFGLIARGVFYFIDAFVTFCRNLSLNNMTEALNDSNITAEKSDELLKKIADLNKQIRIDTLGEIFDIVAIIIAVAVTVLAIIELVQLIMKKEFDNTVMGKVTCAIIGATQKNKFSSEKTVESDTSNKSKKASKGSKKATAINQVDEAAVADDKSNQDN